MARKPIYRTLGGLDPYSDEFCRLLVTRLTRGSRIGMAVSAFAHGLAALMLATPWVLAGYLAWPIARKLLGDWARPEWQWGAAAGAGAIGMVVTYRAISRATVLSALRLSLMPRIIDGSKCLVCRYSLEGLAGRDHLVVCPECGRTVPIGLGAVDLVEQMMARGELPPEGRFAPSAAAANQGVSGRE